MIFSVYCEVEVIQYWSKILFVVFKLISYKFTRVSVLYLAPLSLISISHVLNWFYLYNENDNFVFEVFLMNPKNFPNA